MNKFMKLLISSVALVVVATVEFCIFSFALHTAREAPDSVETVGDIVGAAHFLMIVAVAAVMIILSSLSSWWAWIHRDGSK
jgi:uncharacterized membrane protein